MPEGYFLTDAPSLFIKKKVMDFPVKQKRTANTCSHICLLSLALYLSIYYYFGSLPEKFTVKP